jgi:FkbM family methyltransferase
MSSRIGDALRLLGTAVARPKLAALALRERGMAYIVAEFFRSPDRIGEIVQGLETRALSHTPENLKAAYGDALRDIRDADDLHLEVALTTGERFLIRKASCLNDMFILHEVFVQGVYAGHPRPLEGKVVLDIGGYLGDTAVYFGMRGARVTAYEPSPELFNLALRNVALNGVHADLVNAGVGCRNETLQLTIGDTGADGASTTLFPGEKPLNRAHGGRASVPIVPFADVLAGFDSVFLAKIDCKGCEFPALLSLDPRDLRKVEHFMLQCMRDPADLIAKLEGCGYSIRLPARTYLFADRLADRM